MGNTGPHLIACACMALVLLPGCGRESAEPEQEIRVGQAMSDPQPGFARALQPRTFSFPEDHGPHPAYQHEWWYFTGNLATPEEHRFGYQVTFFRIGLRANPAPRASDWATNALWMAHVAVSDLEEGKHRARERFVRDAAGLAGALPEGRRIWLEDWRIERPGKDGSWSIDIDTPEFGIQLSLSEARRPVLQGEAGLSRKSADPGNASYYYSIPRLETQGRLRVAERSHEVRGLSWLDREWSTSALGADQAGWDWFALQLADGSDLMFYRLRLNSGEADPHSRGFMRLADGSRLDLTPDQVILTPLDWWRAADGRRYPIAWRLRLAALERDLLVRASLADQLMELTVRYWEGAVEVLDPDTRALLGRGYLEMTGY